MIVRIAAKGDGVTEEGELFAGTAPGGKSLGTAMTTVALGPAQAELVTLGGAAIPDDVKSGATPVYAVLTVPPPTVQCRDDDDMSPAEAKCTGPT